MPEKNKSQVKQKHSLLVDDKYLTPVGTPITPIYKRVYDEEKKCEIVKKVDEFDIDEFIQKSSNMTDLAMLKRQMERTGEIPLDPNAQYGVDMTQFPETIHDVYRAANTIDEHFKTLDPVVQEAFGSSSVYRSHVLDGTAQEYLNNYFNEKIAAANVAAGEEK